MVYYVTGDCFKFYKFIDAESDEAYEEAISYFKSHTNYDTGLSAKRRDKLITLVTCASHVDNGRFVVVAREKINSRKRTNLRPLLCNQLRRRFLTFNRRKDYPFVMKLRISLLRALTLSSPM